MILRFCCFIFRTENVVRLKKPVHVLRAAETPPALNYYSLFEIFRKAVPLPVLVLVVDNRL